MTNKVQILTNTDTLKGDTVLNCNPDLTHYCIPVHDPLWFEFRSTGAMGHPGGIGASEVAKFMKTEPEKYEPVLPQVIEQKAGLSTSQRRMTESMLSGILAEPTILHRWGFWDGTRDGYLTNFLARDQKRECKTVNAYIVNKKYPWLFASLDACIKKGYHTLHGELLEEDVPLECKTVGFQAARANDHGIPLAYVYQLQTQMLVTDTNYAELAVLEGGNRFYVEHFEANTEIQTSILEKTYPYWQLILQLREMREERDAYIAAGKNSQAEHVDHQMQQLLPLPGSGDAYDAYYTDKHQPTEDEAFIKGSLKHFDLIRKRLQYAEMSKLWEEKVSEIDNLFSDTFVKEKVNLIEFGTRGKLKFRKYSKNYAPDYKSIKEKIDKLRMRQIFNNHIQQMNQ